MLTSIKVLLSRALASDLGRLVAVWCFRAFKKEVLPPPKKRKGKPK